MVVTEDSLVQYPSLRAALDDAAAALTAKTRPDVDAAFAERLAAAR